MKRYLAILALLIGCGGSGSQCGSQIVEFPVDAGDTSNLGGASTQSSSTNSNVGGAGAGGAGAGTSSNVGAGGSGVGASGGAGVGGTGGTSSVTTTTGVGGTGGSSTSSSSSGTGGGTNCYEYCDQQKECCDAECNDQCDDSQCSWWGSSWCYDQCECDRQHCYESCECDGEVCHSEDCGEGKAQLCHYPPGNTDNRHEICVGEAAVPAHLEHGDTLGCCND